MRNELWLNVQVITVHFKLLKLNCVDVLQFLLLLLHLHTSFCFHSHLKYRIIIFFTITLRKPCPVSCYLLFLPPLLPPILPPTPHPPLLSPLPFLPPFHPPPFLLEFPSSCHLFILNCANDIYVIYQTGGLYWENVAESQGPFS